MPTPSPPPPLPPRPNNRRGFEIAIICALPLEADAIEALFDHHWDDDGPPFGKDPGDPNAYSAGVIGRHNVILAYMPGMGKVNAAVVASNCRTSFPNIRLALVVGVCGVVPRSPDKDEILLGDVIISDGIIQYDFGRQLPDRFVRKDTLLDSLGRPNQQIRGVLAKLRTLRHRRQLSAKMADYLNVLRRDPELRAEYPGTLKDRLFEASYLHTEDQKSCEQLGCNGELVSRSRLETAGVCPTPAVHIGLLASGDSVMKSGKDRDRIAAIEGVIGFEMEGAGVWDIFPSIVIKGACDYADSHKSKVWQRYAAATAAACAKAFLSFWVPSLDEENSCLAANSASSLSLQNQDSSDRSQVACAFDEHQTQPAFLVPFSRNDLFVGRDDVFAKLQGLLFEERRQKVALVGLGGIGKTQIALQLAYWVKKNKQDYSVFWVPALSRASFEQAYMQIADAFGIPTPDSDKATESVRQYLSSKRAGKWLLVVDNADDAQIVIGSAGVENGIYRSLPQNDEGRILFTTRYRKLAVYVAGRHILEVPAMSRDEARSYLKEALIQKISPSDEQVANDLLVLLTYLPLAITQAAAYLNENQISLTEYLHLFENTDRDRIELLSAEFQDGTRYEQSQDPVATTWFISFNQIRKADELASRILMFLACVEPKAVPQSMLPQGESQQQLTRAIGTLCGYGFLNRRGSSEIFDMHSLVHLAIRSWVAENDSEKEQSQVAIARLNEVFPTDDWENRDLWRQYLPHVIKLLSTSKDDWSEESRELGYWAGRCLLVDGRVEEAVLRLPRSTRSSSDLGFYGLWSCLLYSSY
ncbi:Regulatory protein AfsR [Fusarium oxysporum f. sp. rapae]|uniref:Regulatory protein AfsR n=1 Tax=Fusarium oxysporum f. sp. rapae TaxID=485398 RepID=A0A8J5NW79_FUSOX|nr:Regulatory protein AfsR [Fusarium oxysporum f. sp. rapae]